jgi:hypothetical protein
MCEPWLFWSGLALIPFAIICFLVGLRVRSERASLALEIATLVIAGTATSLMGYETAFRTTANDMSELKTNTAVGGLLFCWGVIMLFNALAKVFNK